MEEPTKKEENWRNPDGTLKEGHTALPGSGRPKGQSLKEFWRARFQEMTAEEKLKFTEKVGLETIWKMAEGNPATNTDITSGGKPFYLPSEILEKNDITCDPEARSEGQA